MIWALCGLIVTVLLCTWWMVAALDHCTERIVSALSGSGMWRYPRPPSVLDAIVLAKAQAAARRGEEDGT
jgi:hypothetical protein